VPKQIAVWNTELKLWSKPTEGLFSEHLELFSATWPTSGMTQNGQAFELVMPVRHTKDSESSLLPTLKARDHQAEGYEAGLRRSQPQVGTIVKGIVDGDSRVMELLRSPTASQGQGGALGEAEARKRGNTVGIRDQAMDLAKLQGHKVSREAANKVSVPTPTASDASFDKPGLMRKVTQTAPNRGVGLPLWANRIVTRFYLPTPTTRDYKDGSQPHERDGKVQTDTVARAVFNSGEIIDTNWGKFEPAIRRWEAIIGRPAPEPTKPDGKDGNHRLSSKFTEWMMGLPDGWITGHDLKRNDELKLAGNGVVPQQAELALRVLLELPEERKR
jgi:hypothetical protein